MGAGALGGYVGGYFARAGLDVTLIDPWPEHVETIRARGLELDGVTPEEKFVGQAAGSCTSPKSSRWRKRRSTSPSWR